MKEVGYFIVKWYAVIMVVIIGTFFIIGIVYVIYGLTKIFILKVKEFLKNGGIKYIKENGGFIFFCKVVIKKIRQAAKNGNKYYNRDI